MEAEGCGGTRQFKKLGVQLEGGVCPFYRLSPWMRSTGKLKLYTTSTGCQLHIDRVSRCTTQEEPFSS